MSDTRKLHLFGRKLPPAPPPSTLPDWQQANPLWIAHALKRSQALPPSGWTVVDASRMLRDVPRRYRLSGRDWVAWRTPQGPRLAPDACPHMGASLANGRVCGEDLVCAWHGLHLGAQAHGSWRPVPTFDDGVLFWAALDPERPRHEPTVLSQRPTRFFDAVIRKPARCAPADVIANRLDPWHGSHYHPYAFGRLRVLERDDDAIFVRVVYRTFGRYGIEVDARFSCPDPTTIVMRIERGEGTGSLVETHVAAIDAEHTAIVEATLATSDRAAFWWVVRGLGGLLRPLVRKAAMRLWVDDAAYAERLAYLRREADALESDAPHRRLTDARVSEKPALDDCPSSPG